MKKTTLETFNSDTASGQVIVFFHKDWCSRCAQVKPILEEMEKQHWDIVFLSYFCTTPDEITNRHKFKMFPWIWCYKDWKQIAWWSEMFPVELYPLAFMEYDEMIKAHYHTARSAANAEQLFQNKKTQAMFFTQVLQKIESTPESNLSEDFELPTITHRVEWETCESCQ